MKYVCTRLNFSEVIEERKEWNTQFISYLETEPFSSTKSTWFTCEIIPDFTRKTLRGV